MILADYFDILFLDNKSAAGRRKDPGSLGVPVSQLERQASPQQTGLEGVEKTSSPKIQASLAQTCGVRDSYETAAARSSRDGTSSPPELRHVPQTGGDVRPLSEKSGEPVHGTGRQYRMYTLVIRDQEEGVPDKTGVYSNSLNLDNPETQTWLGPMLRSW